MSKDTESVPCLYSLGSTAIKRGCSCVVRILSGAAAQNPHNTNSSTVNGGATTPCINRRDL